MTIALPKHGCGAIILSTDCLNPAEYPWFSQVNSTKPRILLIQRGTTAPTYPEEWAGPAGLREDGETPEEAAAREAAEEISIRFQATTAFYDGELNGRKLSYFLGGWEAPAQLTVQTNEVAGYGWFSFEDALKLRLAFRWREAIELLIEYFRPD